jgi:rod shape-determining protein MreC
MARLIEGLRGGSNGFLRSYILLHDATEENKRLREELDKLKIENHFLKTELNTSERAKALQIFQSRTASRTMAATVIGTGAGTNAKLVFIDRGSREGVQRGMAVVTPDGIVGKVLSSYPTASEVLLVTDPDFAAGVIAQKSGVRGTLKGQGSPLCKMDYVPIEEKVEVGEWIYTSGDDRIFPKGFPVGVVKVVRNSQPFKEILVEPAGLHRGLEDVLVMLEGVHQTIPTTPPIPTQVYVSPPPPADPAQAGDAKPTAPGTTEADKLREKYKAIGDAQNHVYGDNLPGSRPVDFNAKPVAPPKTEAVPKPEAGSAAPPVTTPAAPAQAPPGAANNKPLDPAAAARRARQVGDQPPPPADAPKPAQPKPVRRTPANDPL